MNKPTDTSIYRFLNSNIQAQNQELKNLYIDDPTVMGFNLYVDINDYYSPLFTETNVYASAIQYLKRINEKARAVMLSEFKYRLRDLVTLYPYYLQSVSGLGEIYKYNAKETWRARDKVLKFKTIESVDLRIGNMIDKYRRAIFDEIYMRDMLPINLRKFNCHLVVSEIRNFKTFYQTVLNGGQATTVQVLNDFLSCYVYRLEGCRFDFSESNPWMESINNAKPDNPSENGFSIVFDRVYERHKMNMIDAYTGDQNGISDKDRERFFTGIDGQASYRRAQWGSPKTGDFGQILQVEQQTQQVPGKTSLITSVRDYILDQPEIKKMQADFEPEVLKGRAENFVLDKFRSTIGRAVLGNVFDVRNSLFNGDITSAFIGNLDRTPLNQTLETAEKTTYDNRNESVPVPPNTQYNNQTGTVGTGGRTTYDNSTQDIDNTGRTIYADELGVVRLNGQTIYRNNLGRNGVSGPSVGNNRPLGNISTPGRTQPLEREELNIYTISPESIGDLGMNFKLVSNVDFFRTFLGNINVADRPFSNLLSTLVGGVIPNLIRRDTNVT